MKRFRFRLQKYLNLKQQEEGIRRIYLAEAQQYYHKQEEIMRSIQKELKKTLAQKREFLQEGRIDRDLIEMAECYLEYQKEQQNRQETILEEARVELIKQQLELLNAQKERKLSERLYNRRWTDYYQEFLREEQKSLDEIGIICFFRQQEESVR